MIRLLAILGLLMLAGCSVFGVRTTGEPPFTVVDSIGDSEIRRYPVRAAAEVRLGDAGERAGSTAAQGQAFRILFDYIQGANDGGRKIAMTAPVEQQAGGSRIAMTAPVETVRDDGAFVMRFFLPQALTAGSAPAPTDARVEIVELAARHYAVRRFTGWWTDAGLERRQAALVEALAESGWTVAGAPVAWFYDPPWTIPFLRRNEVAVPVEPG
jgi:hypothetical protein